MTDSGQSVMEPAERARRRICESVTDAQAHALVVLRMRLGDEALMFSRERWSDGARLVVDADLLPVALLNPAGEPIEP